jgi:hypothetical protein
MNPNFIFKVPEVMETVSCEKCGKAVSPFDLPEHLDFHVAQDLQRQMRSETKSVPTKVDVVQPSKRKSKDGPPQPQEKRQKNILSFFQKKD